MSRISRGNLSRGKGVVGVDAVTFEDGVFRRWTFLLRRLLDVVVGALISGDGFVCCWIRELRRRAGTLAAVTRDIIESFTRLPETLSRAVE